MGKDRKPSNPTTDLLRRLAAEPELVVDEGLQGRRITATTAMYLFEGAADWLDANRNLEKGSDAYPHLMVRALRNVAESLFTEAQRLRAEDFRSGKVGIEYINGIEDASASCEKAANELQKANTPNGGK